jgi:hypothetical protein
LAALCAPTPLAVVIKARLRVLPKSTTITLREQHTSPDAAAARIVELVAEGRVFVVDAVGSTLQLLAGAGSPRSVGHGTASASLFAHDDDTARARFDQGRALAPGDTHAIARALHDGQRVVAAPFMGRVGVLTRGRRDVVLGDVDHGIRDFAAALLTSSPTPSSLSTLAARGAAHE